MDMSSKEASMRKDHLLLNHDFLIEQIKQQGYKQYYLAYRLKISEKTVSRWVNRKVSSVSRENAQSLCKILHCSINDLTKTRQGLTNDQIYQQLFSDDLLEILSPGGSWETLLNILLHLPEDNIHPVTSGKRYNWLSIAYWRTGRYNKALEYGERAREIGKEVGHDATFYQALCNLGTVYGLMGNAKKALRYYTLCYQNLDKIENKRSMATVCNNLAMTYFDLFDYPKALDLQKKTIVLYTEEKDDYRLSIAYTVKGFCETELKQFASAKSSLKTAKEYARRSNYTEGLNTIPLYSAYLEAQNKNPLTSATLDKIMLPLEKHTKDPYIPYLAAYCYHEAKDQRKALHFGNMGLELLQNQGVLSDKIKALFTD